MLRNQELFKQYVLILTYTILPAVCDLNIYISLLHHLHQSNEAYKYTMLACNAVGMT